MLKNDRMMTILTGLVLAIFAGTMVKYGDRIMDLMSGSSANSPQNDSYSVRAGSAQILDVLSNDAVFGPIVVLSNPSCGIVELTGNNKVSFSSPANCSGEVAFSYCVDAEGACDTIDVNINVISVNYAQQPATETTTATVQNNTTAQPESTTPDTVVVAQAPQPSGSFGSAPQISTISASMSPPTLAAPSIPELVSPSIAMASIYQSAGGLTRAKDTDQNITAQNSAEATQTTFVESSGFQAPSLEESSNVSLGGSGRNVATVVAAAPTGLQSTSDADANVTKFERGPVALAAMHPNPADPSPQELAPLVTSPERTNFAPIEIAAVQSVSSTPDQNFTTFPQGGGPIALVAMQSARNGGDAAGESLNVILTEPGVQIFANAQVPPTALAPASAGLSEVTVLEHAPSVIDHFSAPMPAPQFNGSVGVLTSRLLDSAIAREALAGPSTPNTETAFAITASVTASLPNQISAPSGLAALDSPALLASVPAVAASTNRGAGIAVLGNPVNGAFSLPTINLAPAEHPVIQLASLPVAPDAPVDTAPVQNSQCEISLDTRARSGANIALDIVSSCKPDQMVTVSHAGLVFSVLTDAQGSASVTLPAMQSDAEITVNFEDQSSQTIELFVNDIDSVLRAGVSWRSNVDLDLNAFEYGAAIGSDGHISPQSPRDYRSSRVRGGGYLVQLGDPSLERGALAEVYTTPVSRNQQRGTIELSIVIDDAPQVCGQVIIAKTIRSREGRDAASRNVRFTVPECGSVAAQITLPGAIDDIRLAGR